MGKIIRILIAIIMVLSFVLLGRNEAAWAANAGADRSASQSAERSVSSGKNDHCNPKDKNRKEECEDNDGEGTVRPPRHRTKVCKLGTFSVGGVATMEVKKLGYKDCVTAFTAPYDPQSDPPLPPGTKPLTDLLSVKLPKKDAEVKICFAAPPGKNVGIYTISRHAWVSAGASNTNGKTCTETSSSGTFVLLQ